MNEASELFMNKSRQITWIFQNHDLTVKGINLGLGGSNSESPSILIDHTSYPGVEAHLFTIAHAAQWSARFTDDRDVLLHYSLAKHVMVDEHDALQVASVAWKQLLSVFVTIMDCLKLFREDIAHGEFTTVVWGHHATEWHRELWESKIHDYANPSEFLDYVDSSIRPHILELNNLGFATVESCSGLLVDHPDRVPYRPYVMFDERSYFGSAPHFFTLGDMAGWESLYAPHGFDVYIRVITGDDVEEAWSRLVTNARILGPLLSSYRESNGRKHPFSKELTQESAQGSDSVAMCSSASPFRRTQRMSGLQ
jgi:hypothetical protein